jgi:hypothetical protein
MSRASFCSSMPAGLCTVSRQGHNVQRQVHRLVELDHVRAGRQVHPAPKVEREGHAIRQVTLLHTKPPGFRQLENRTQRHVQPRRLKLLIRLEQAADQLLLLDELPDGLPR